jgi:hypothetical protein
MFQLPKILLLALAWTGAVKAAVIERPFLYEIKSPHGQVSYLFGSIHTGVALGDFSPTLPAILKNSRVIVFERKPATLSNRPKGPIGAKLREQLLAAGVSAGILNQIGDEDCYLAGRFRRPWNTNLDAEILNLAEREKIETSGLETQEALAETNTLGSKCSLAEISSRPGGVTEWLRQFDAELSATVADYKTGEAGTRFSSDIPSMRVRNLVWLPALTAQLDQGRAFVVVGVAHLFGYSGLIELLKDRKFELRRISP